MFHYRLRPLLDLILWGKRGKPNKNAPHHIHDAIRRDLGPLLSRLSELGYAPTKSEYSPHAFGNYFVDFSGPTGCLRLVRDRSQYTVEAERDSLEAAGLQNRVCREAVGLAQVPNGITQLENERR
jgi:hypothetical protein